MLTRSSPTLKQTKFDPVEEGVLVQLNKRLKLTEVTDKKAEVLGAITRIGYSAEKMATFCNDLNAVISAESHKAGFSFKSLSRRSLSYKNLALTENVLTKEIATELREQITRFFPITAFTLRPPAPEDILDIILESYVKGAYKYRFYQVDAADGFLDEISIIRKEVLRSLVTGLRGIGNFRNVKTQEVYAADDPFKDLSVDNVIATLKGMKSLSAQASASHDKLDILLADLAKFEQVGIRAHALLSENRLCYGGIESNFRDWGALSANPTCPVQKIIKMLETDLLIPGKRGQVVAFMEKLNQVIVEAVQISVEFEALRHVEEGVEIEQASKALTKDLYREPSALYAESNIAAAEKFYRGYQEEAKKADDEALGAVGGVSKKEEKMAGKFKLLTVAGGFFKRRQQDVQFKPKEKQRVDIPAETGDLASRLPLGFAYQDGEYVFQGNAQSVEYLSELMELAVNQSEPVKKYMDWEFISYSDGMYRMKGSPYYMLIEGHIYSSDLACELIKQESSSHEVKDGSEAQPIYETIRVPDGREIPLTKDITVKTPIKIIPDNLASSSKSK